MPPLTYTRQHSHGAVLLVHPRAWGQSTRVEAHIVSCPWTICRAKLCPSHWPNQRLTSKIELSSDNRAVTTLRVHSHDGPEPLIRY